MSDALDYLAQMANEIRDGQSHLAHLRKVEPRASDLKRQTEADVDHLKRVFTTIRLRIERQIAGVELEQVIEDVRTAEARARLKEEVA